MTRRGPRIGGDHGNLTIGGYGIKVANEGVSAPQKAQAGRPAAAPDRGS